MFGFLLAVLMVVLLATSVFMVVIILMQKPSANAGMGAALGGGAAESVFGGETANVLLKYTVRVAVIYFVLSFLLYLGNIYYHRGDATANVGLPNIAGPATPTTATTSAATTT